MIVLAAQCGAKILIQRKDGEPDVRTCNHSKISTLILPKVDEKQVETVKMTCILRPCQKWGYLDVQF